MKYFINKNNLNNKFVIYTPILNAIKMNFHQDNFISNLVRNLFKKTLIKSILFFIIIRKNRTIIFFILRSNYQTVIIIENVINCKLRKNIFKWASSI